MKTLSLKSFFALSLLMGTCAWAETQIKNISVEYSRLLLPVDRNGFAIPQAAIGGFVDFEGEDSVLVTLNIGGQSFTSPLNKNGEFSFFVYTAGDNSYEVEAWVSGAPSNDQKAAKLKKELK